MIPAGERASSWSPVQNSVQEFGQEGSEFARRRRAGLPPTTAHNTVFAMPLAQEDGAWEVASLAECRWTDLDCRRRAWRPIGPAARNAAAY
jgi:hypothetical protein